MNHKKVAQLGGARRRVSKKNRVFLSEQPRVQTRFKCCEIGSLPARMLSFMPCGVVLFASDGETSTHEEVNEP